MCQSPFRADRRTSRVFSFSDAQDMALHPAGADPVQLYLEKCGAVLYRDGTDGMNHPQPANVGWGFLAGLL